MKNTTKVTADLSLDAVVTYTSKGQCIYCKIGKVYECDLILKDPIGTYDIYNLDLCLNCGKQLLSRDFGKHLSKQEIQGLLEEITEEIVDFHEREKNKPIYLYETRHCKKYSFTVQSFTFYSEGTHDGYLVTIALQGRNFGDYKKWLPASYYHHLKGFIDLLDHIDWIKKAYAPSQYSNYQPDPTKTYPVDELDEIPF